MIKKFQIALLILTLGLFLTPTLAYACGTKSMKTEKSCCKKDKSVDTDKKDCCKNHKTTNEKDDSGCGGNCNNSNCSCLAVHYTFNLPSITDFKTKALFAESKKVKCYYNETYLSSGFISIWTPPNIG